MQQIAEDLNKATKQPSLITKDGVKCWISRELQRQYVQVETKRFKPVKVEILQCSLSSDNWISDRKKVKKYECVKELVKLKQY